jgi:Zn-dependent protease
MEQITFGLIWYVVFLFSTCCHEAAHSLVALKLGDPTAYLGGQVSINPVPHVRREPLGTVLVPLVSFLAGGWMIGWASAPYDPYWAERYPKRSAFMSLAGPSANLLLVVFTGIVIRVGLALGHFQIAEDISFTQIILPTQAGFASGIATMISIMFSLNLLLFVFNLIPLPPLDGSGAIPLVLPEKQASSYVEFLHQHGSQFIFLFIAWRAMDYIFNPFFSRALDVLFLGI